jgi:hypothetical protein
MGLDNLYLSQTRQGDIMGIMGVYGNHINTFYN